MTKEQKISSSTEEELMKEVAEESGINQEVVRNILSIYKRKFEEAVSVEEKASRRKIRTEEVIKITTFHCTPKGKEYCFTKFWTKKGRFIGGGTGECD